MPRANEKYKRKGARDNVSFSCSCEWFIVMLGSLTHRSKRASTDEGRIGPKSTYGGQIAGSVRTVLLEVDKEYSAVGGPR